MSILIRNLYTISVMGQAIDGKLLASELGKKLAEKIGKLKERPLVVSILIGNDPNSLLYTQMKQKKAEEFNIDFLPMKFPVKSTFDNVAGQIQKLNDSSEVKGIMIQLPVPKDFLQGRPKWDLINLIAPDKDIDGMLDMSPFVSATVKGVIRILDEIEIDYQGLVFGVVGSEGEVGKPMVDELSKKGAKQIIGLDKRNPECDLTHLKKADVVISCTGVQGLITSEMVKDGIVAVDVGLGDFDPAVYGKTRMYTPKFGGVGPMTVYCLMENILEAAGK